jgi:hypothetical protein
LNLPHKKPLRKNLLNGFNWGLIWNMHFYFLFFYFYP